jgi:hypothetical protein
MQEPVACLTGWVTTGSTLEPTFHPSSALHLDLCTPEHQQYPTWGYERRVGTPTGGAGIQLPRSSSRTNAARARAPFSESFPFSSRTHAVDNKIWQLRVPPLRGITNACRLTQTRKTKFVQGRVHAERPRCGLAIATTKADQPEQGL